MIVFFFFAPFFCRVSVLDCCTGQYPGNERTVLLVSLQATKGGGGQSQAMLLRFGWGQRAHVACGRGFRCVVGGKPSTLLWEEVSSHNKLAARAVKVA